MGNNTVNNVCPDISQHPCYHSWVTQLTNYSTFAVCLLIEFNLVLMITFFIYSAVFCWLGVVQAEYFPHCGFMCNSCLFSVFPFLSHTPPFLHHVLCRNTFLKHLHWVSGNPIFKWPVIFMSSSVCLYKTFAKIAIRLLTVTDKMSF